MAVSTGAVIFNLLWLRSFHTPYLPADQAQKVYLSLRPLASATAIDAALTGVLLWLAGLIRECVVELRRLPSHSGIHCAAPVRPDHRRRQNAEDCRLG